MLDFSKIHQSVRLQAGQIVKDRWAWMQRTFRMTGEPSLSPEDIYVVSGTEMTVTIDIVSNGNTLFVFRVQLNAWQPGVIEAKVWQSPNKETSKLQPDGFFKVIPDFRAVTSDEAADLLIEHWPVIEVMDC